MSTVAFSVLWACAYFVSLLAVCGPRNKTGHIPIWKYLCHPCHKKRKQKKLENKAKNKENNDTKPTPK